MDQQKEILNIVATQSTIRQIWHLASKLDQTTIKTPEVQKTITELEKQKIPTNNLNLILAQTQYRRTTTQLTAKLSYQMIAEAMKEKQKPGEAQQEH